MNKYFTPFIFTVFVLLQTSLSLAEAHNLDSKELLQHETTLVQHSKSDSVKHHVMVRGANGLIVMPAKPWIPFDDDVRFRDTMIFNPAYLPIVFTGKVLPDKLDFTTKSDVKLKKNQFYLIDPDSTFVSQLRESENIRDMRRDYFINNPEKIKYDLSDLVSQQSTIEEEKAVIHKRNILEIMTEGPSEISELGLQRVMPKRVYWIKHGEHMIQVAQNHISKNWYKGGNSNFMVRNYHKFTANYEKGKVKLDNLIEWKLNLQNTPANDLHDINISEDLLRFYNVLGYKAVDKWSYTSTLETRTQLFNSYPVDSKERRTSFLSPLYVNLGLGMSYNLEKSYKSDKFKKLKYTLSLSPLSFNMIYVGDSKVNPVNFGVEEGKKTKMEYGSLLNTELSYRFNRYVSWTSRFKYFTNYTRIEGEFENKVDMALSRFFSTSVYLFLRYDDDKETDRDWGHFQVNEIISFGLSYKW